MQGKYAVYIRSKDGTLTGRINDFVSLRLIMTLNDPGSWSMSSVSVQKCPFIAGDGIVVVRNGTFLFGGMLTEISDEFDANTSLHRWQAQGKGDLEYLNRRICYVDPYTGRTDQYSHYTATDALSSVIRDLIRLNLGPDALTGRQEGIIADHLQDSAGPSVTVALRFQNLLETVVALAYGNSWNVRANWDEDANKVYYDIFQGRDLTNSIVFTEQLSNITAAEYLASVPQANFVLAGGTGEMTARSFATAQNDDSISEWGRVEVFQDARNQHNVTDYVEEVLKDKSADTVGYGCTASNEGHTPQFGTDYTLGDFVGMKVFGQFLTVEVQQCEISVEDGIETVEPRFGTVAVGKLRNIFRQLADLRADVNELLGTEVA